MSLDGVGPEDGAAPARLPGAPRVPFTRLHPVSPLVRGWAALLVGLALVLDGVVGAPVGGPVPGFPSGEDLGPAAPDLPIPGGLGPQVGVVVVMAFLVVLGNVLGWFFTRYAVDDTAVHLHSGVLSRTQRQARLDRLQAVDVVQPLIGRLVGLAELRIEVAGGADSQVRLRYLKEAEAQRLRNALLAAAAGVEYEQGEEAPEAPEREVLQVPPGRLVAGTALTGTVIVLLLGALALAAALGAAALLPTVSTRMVLAPIAAIGPGALLAIVVTVGEPFAKSFASASPSRPTGCGSGPGSPRPAPRPCRPAGCRRSSSASPGCGGASTGGTSR